MADLQPRTPTSRAGGAANSADAGRKYSRHAVIGDLTLDYDTWDNADDSGQHLVVFTAAPGSDAETALRSLQEAAAGSPESRAG